MNRFLLSNFCFEPETAECTCTIGLCGGIIGIDPSCSEHAGRGHASNLIKSHFHPIQASARAS